MGKRYPCHKISEGKAAGDAVLSQEKICFYQVRPSDGMMEEKGHDLEGRILAGKVIIFPGGKGSSVVQQDGLFHLNKYGNMPAALIITSPEPVLVSDAIIMEIPLVDRLPADFYKDVKDGDDVFVNADEGYVEIRD